MICTRFMQLKQRRAKQKGYTRKNIKHIILATNKIYQVKCSKNSQNKKGYNKQKTILLTKYKELQQKAQHSKNIVLAKTYATYV